MTKILIVEDSKDISSMLKSHLELEGFNTEIASDGIEALEKVKTIKPDLIILDIMLPNVDGWEVLLKIRGGKELKTPIIILSAKSEDISKITAFKHGADDYVTKPFDPQELTERVKAILRRYKNTTSDGKEMEYKRKIPVYVKDRIKLISLEEVVWCENLKGSTYVGTKDGIFCTKLSLIELEDKLGKEVFFRVHRSYIVNKNYVREIKKLPNSRYSIILDISDFKEVPVSRRTAREFKKTFL